MKPTAAELVGRHLYGALDGRESAAAATVLDDASVLHIGGSSGLAGDYQGNGAIDGLLRRMGTLAGGTLRYGAARLSSGSCRQAVLVGRASAVRRGRRLDVHVTFTVSIRNGLVRHASLACDEQRAWDTFWA